MTWPTLMMPAMAPSGRTPPALSPGQGNLEVVPALFDSSGTNSKDRFYPVKGTRTLVKDRDHGRGLSHPQEDDNAGLVQYPGATIRVPSDNFLARA